MGFIDPLGLTFEDVVRVYMQVNLTFPDVDPNGALMCAELPEGKTGFTVGVAHFSLLPRGTIQVPMRWCKKKCLSRKEWEDLFFTIFHEAMHSTEVWDLSAYSNSNHERIFARELFERSRLPRFPYPLRPVWGTPLPAPGANLDALYDEYKRGASDCCR